MEGFFHVTVSGEETLTNDLNDNLNAMRGPIRDGLRFVGSEMIVDLQRHIQKDWYEAWGDPKEYERRTDDPSRGTPLGDDSNMHTDVHDMSLSFVYTPNGRHVNHAWQKRDGDKLIEVIQTNSGWSWQPRKDTKGRPIIGRPFWNNFAEEQFNGAAFDAFEYGFAGRGFDLVREGGKRDVEYSPGESMLDATDENYELPL